MFSSAMMNIWVNSVFLKTGYPEIISNCPRMFVADTAFLTSVSFGNVLMALVCCKTLILGCMKPLEWDFKMEDSYQLLGEFFLCLMCWSLRYWPCNDLYYHVLSECFRNSVSLIVLKVLLFQLDVYLEDPHVIYLLISSWILEATFVTEYFS